MTGYKHPNYAFALAEYGCPRHLTNSEGWILVAPIAGVSAYDARGSYPLFSCRNWSRLKEDVEALKDEIVSLVMVIDPIGNYTDSVLKSCFRDLCIPYKKHYVTDLKRPITDIISTQHARNIRKANKLLRVERCEYPLKHAFDWVNLYGTLVDRHKIKGIASFSEKSFRKQLQVPGLEMFRAVHQKKTVGMLLWYVQDDVGYYHLGAYSDTGYQLRASFALMEFSITYFSTFLRLLNIGSGAGIYNDENDGLTRFKKGWATGTRTAYLCGRIFNQEVYDDLVRRRCIQGDGFFPLYRKGEVW